MMLKKHEKEIMMMLKKESRSPLTYVDGKTRGVMEITNFIPQEYTVEYVVVLHFVGNKILEHNLRYNSVCKIKLSQ